MNLIHARYGYGVRWHIEERDGWALCGYQIAADDLERRNGADLTDLCRRCAASQLTAEGRTAHRGRPPHLLKGGKSNAP